MSVSEGLSVLDKRKNEIKRLIPDENLRHVIFNYDDTMSTFLRNDRNMISYFHNALTFSSFIIYRAFLKWKREFNLRPVDEKERELRGFSNSITRLINLLEGCYDLKKFDLEMIENLMVNLQIDTNVTGSGSKGFLKIIGIDNYIHFNDNLTKYIYKLKCARLSTKMDIDFNFNNLCDVLEMMVYLSRSELALYDYAGIEGAPLQCAKLKVSRPSKTEIDLGGMVAVLNDMTYYLEDFSINDPRIAMKENPLKNQTLTLNYVANGRSYPLKVNLSDSLGEEIKWVNDDEYSVCKPIAIEEFLIDCNSVNVSTKGKTGEDEGFYFFKDYISFNNKYIKYLALTIADFISIETKNYIINRYRQKYVEVFDKLQVRSLYGNSGAQYYCWDEMIILLLLEEGVFDFLCFILQYESYESFLLAFCRRFGEEKIEEIKRDNILIQKPTLNLRYVNVASETRSKAKAIILLATKLLTIDDINYSSFYFSPSIEDIISDLQKKNENQRLSVFEKTSYSINLLLRVVLFVDSFYCGLLSFARELRQWELSLIDESRGTLDLYNKTKDEILERAFTKEVVKRKDENLHFTDFNHYSDPKRFIEGAKVNIAKAFDQLIDNNRQIMKRDNPLNEALYESVGKRQIFDEGEMLIFKHGIDECLASCLGMNNSRVSCERLYKQILEFFKFLQSGSVNEAGMLEDAIYPLVGTYSNGVVSCDGYRYSYMTFNRRNDDAPIKIKMITDDVFDFGQMYYCIPNVKRVANIVRSRNEKTERIWVNPIIIPHQYYSSNFNTEFSRLSNKEDLEEAASLLYQTDSQIYGGLFGSRENAIRILPLLFEDRSSVFYKDNYYIIKIGNEIVSIASLYHSLPSWDCDVVEKAFRTAGVEITEKTQRAYKYFEDTFGESVGNNSVICDLCVDENFRQQGVARCMISNIIRQMEGTGRNLIISAYKDNKIAINLYTSMGFIPYLSTVDTRGQDENNQEYYKLIKYI